MSDVIVTIRMRLQSVINPALKLVDENILRGETELKNLIQQTIDICMQQEPIVEKPITDVSKSELLRLSKEFSTVARNIQTHVSNSMHISALLAKAFAAVGRLNEDHKAIVDMNYLLLAKCRMMTKDPYSVASRLSKHIARDITDYCKDGADETDNNARANRMLASTNLLFMWSLIDDIHTFTTKLQTLVDGRQYEGTRQMIMGIDKKTAFDPLLTADPIAVFMARYQSYLNKLFVSLPTGSGVRTEIPEIITATNQLNVIVANMMVKIENQMTEWLGPLVNEKEIL